MFVVREYVQECGCLKVLVHETPFDASADAINCLKRAYGELFAHQEEWSGVWSSYLGEDYYSIDNNDGDLFDGCVVEEFHRK